MRQCESLADRGVDLIDIGDQETVLDHRPGHSDDVHLLKRVGADVVEVDLPGEDHHRDGVHERVGDSGHQIGRAGAGGGHADADLAGGPGVTAGGERAALFVTRQHDTDGGVGQRLVKFHGGRAGVGETKFHSE